MSNYNNLLLTDEEIAKLPEHTVGYTTFKDFLIAVIVIKPCVIETENPKTFKTQHAVIMGITPLTKKAAGCPFFPARMLASSDTSLMLFYKDKKDAINHYNNNKTPCFLSLDMPRLHYGCKIVGNIYTDIINDLDEAAQNAEILCAILEKNIIFKYNNIEIEVTPDLTWRKIINKYRKAKEV